MLYFSWHVFIFIALKYQTKGISNLLKKLIDKEIRVYMLESDKELSELSKSDFNDNLKCNWFTSRIS